MSNRATGNRFEQELAKILAENGFWCHVMQQNKAGQPADIIAVKRHYHTLIDCKVISGEKLIFPFSRVEENQKFAMSRFQERGGQVCWFALRLPNGEVRMLSFFYVLRMMKNGKKCLSGDELLRRSNGLDVWLNYAEVESLR